MAQQESILKLKGKIGDLTFYETKNGYQARQVKGVSAERIATEPRYQRTRENNAEFAAVAAATKRLRDTLRPMILLTHDPKMSARLFSRVMRMVKADAVSDRGERRVQPNNLSLLGGFRFNVAASLTDTLFVKRALTVDREAGTAQVDLPSFKPGLAIAAPTGATHFQFSFGVAALDFEAQGTDNLSELSMVESEIGVLLQADAFPSMTLTTALPPESELPLVVLFGVSFLQQVNNKQYALNNGAYNPIDIIQIDVV